MTTPAPLDDLIARLEQATGPDRGLDAEIACATGALPVHAPDWVKRWDTPFVLAAIRGCRAGEVAALNTNDTVAWLWSAPAYTAGLDAALTLLHPDHWYLLGKGRARPDEPLYGVIIRAANLQEEITVAEAEHPASMAICVCLAALKAKPQ